MRSYYRIHSFQDMNVQVGFRASLDLCVVPPGMEASLVQAELRPAEHGERYRVGLESARPAWPLF